MTAWPKNLAGLNGAPENSNNRIRTPKIGMTTIGSKKAIPFQILFIQLYVQVEKIEH